MGLLNLQTSLLLVVSIVVVANASLFSPIEEKLAGPARNLVQTELRHFQSSLEQKIFKWVPLSPSSGKHRAFPLNFISADEKKKIQYGSKLQLYGFSYSSCGPADQLVDIKKLDFQPTIIYFPGNLNFSFDIVFRDTIQADASVNADLLLEYSAGQGQWVKIPCVGGIGSCTYEDVCSLSQQIPCPPELTDQGIPCSCPFNKGEYILNNFGVNVAASIFLSGDYQGQATFTDSKLGQIACYKFAFTIG